MCADTKINYLKDGASLVFALQNHFNLTHGEQPHWPNMFNKDQLNQFLQ